MKSRNVLIALGVAAALAAGVGAYSFTASAQGGPGWMMGGGYGPGYMRGSGGGSGAGPWNCPAFGQNDEQGSGPAGRQGEGYGPGYHMRGGYGPGMMGGNGYGPGMMQGYGPGYDRRGDVQGNQSVNLSTDDVKNRMERWLNWRGNARLKVGEVKEKDADSFTADIVTKENSLVERFIVDRHSGFVRRDNS
jgi:hypothetical protein